MAKTVVLLTASWCPRCPAARRLWERLREGREFEFQEFDIDSREGQEMAERYNIQSVPSVIANGRLWDGTIDEAGALRGLDGESRN